MKRFICIFLLAGVAMFYFGCSENSPIAPELNKDNQSTTNLGKQTVYTYFNGTSETQLPFIYNGRMNILPDGTVQIRGCIVATEDILTDPRISGMMTWIVNMDIYPDGSDKRWGSGVSENELWDLTFKGWNDPVVEGVTYEVNGHGKGDYSGMKTHMTYLKPVGEPLFTVDGYIIEHI